MSSIALGTGDVGLTASYTSLGACFRTRAEFDSPVFFFSSVNFPHKASPYSMDDRDPQKFFMSGEEKWV